MHAIKCIKQEYESNSDLDDIMETFRQMVNHCIRIGLENNCSTLKKLSLLSYRTLKNYEIPSYYKLTAISSACGRLSQMKHDIRKGGTPKSPCIKALSGVMLWIQDKWDVAVNSHREQKLCPCVTK